MAKQQGSPDAPRVMNAEISFTLNGQPHTLAVGATVTVLLSSLQMNGPVLVERNGEALFPREFDTTPLAAGDRMEIIRVVAGG